MELLSHMRRQVETYVTAYNELDVEGMMSVIHPEIVFENVRSGHVTHAARGSADFRKMVAQTAELFSEREQRVTTWDDGINTLDVEVDYKGRLASDLPNGMRKGQTVEIRGRSEFVFEDGLVIGLRDIS